MRPTHTPLGLQLNRTSRTVARAFDEGLVQAGGSLPIWLVLLNLRIHQVVNQRQLADVVGVTGRPLTHHLNAMEGEGLLVRRRDPANRRNHLIELTAGGEAAFLRLATAAQSFDARLRAGISEAELATARDLLDRLAANVGGGEPSTTTRQE